jgi:hypothetical protein
MKLRLLSAHVVPVGPGCDRWLPAGAVLDPPPPGYRATPLMEGLDPEGVEAVVQVRLEVWGRYPWPYGLRQPMGETPLDDPPIPRPLDDNQPVFHYVGSPEYL